MATFNKFQPFVEARNEGKHNFASDSLKIALTNTAPNATDATLSQITEVSYTNCSSRAVTTSSSSQTGGTYSLVCADLILTASGGSVGPFRYIILYNDTATNDDLISYWDYGSSITLADTENFLIDFGSSVFTDT